MVHDIFHAYELPPTTITALDRKLQCSPERLLGFLMDFHHKEQLPTLSRAYKTAATLALSYFLGGLIPLIPYFIVERHEVLTALWWSIGVMGITLLVFGYSKTCIVVGWSGWRNIMAGSKGGLQMLFVGAAAAGAAVGLVRAIEQGGIYV
jgi:vacuolar iron transporter family protein